MTKIRTYVRARHEIKNKSTIICSQVEDWRVIVFAECVIDDDLVIHHLYGHPKINSWTSLEKNLDNVVTISSSWFTKSNQDICRSSFFKSLLEFGWFSLQIHQFSFHSFQHGLFPQSCTFGMFPISFSAFACFFTIVILIIFTIQSIIVFIFGTTCYLP